MRTRILHAACLLAAAALPAFANEVPFEVIGSGVGGFAQPAGNYVAKSRAELDQQGLTQFLSQQALDGIDWADEMVVGVFMGGQSSGGYGISVRRIERRQLAQIQPVPTPPPVFELAIDVLRVTPGPGDIVTMALTAPFQVVKLARSSDLIRFYDVPTRLDFDRFRRSIGGFGFSRSIEVEASGAVTITSGAPGIGGTPRIDRGTADAGQLDRLRRALALAEFTTLPADMGIPAGTPFPMDAPITSYVREAQGLTQRVSGFRPNASDAIKARLAGIDRELDAIAEAVLPAFDSVLFATTTAEPGDSLTVTVSIARSGAVVVTMRYAVKEIHFMPVHAQAPQALIADLDLALRTARIGQMPAYLGPIGGTPQRRFDLQVQAPNADYAGTVAGDMDHLPTAQAWRLNLVFDAVTAISDHARQHAGATEFKGIVRVQGGAVLLEGPHQSVTVADAAVAAVLRSFEGRTVKLQGDLAGDTMTDAVIVYPQRAQGRTALVQTDANGDAVAIIGFGAPAVSTFGPAAPVMALGAGREVTFDGYLFLDADQKPEELFVESVQATMKRFAWQTVSGTITGFLRRGDVVTVDRLSSTGRYARAADAETAGYVRTTSLEVGRPFTALPTAPQPSAGMTGALPGAGQ